MIRFKRKALLVSSGLVMSLIVVCNLFIFTHKNRIHLNLHSAIDRNFAFSRIEGSWSYDFDVIAPEILNAKEVENVKTTVSTSILFDFGPYIFNHFKQMFPNHVANNSANFHPRILHPSCIVRARDKSTIVCAVRIWLASWVDDEKIEMQKEKTNRDTFQESYVYILELDQSLSIKWGSGRLVPLPSQIGHTMNGPEDPRLFEFGEQLMFLFAAGHFTGPGNSISYQQFIWSVEENVLYNINVTDMQLNEHEKNWIAYVDDGNPSQLNLIYCYLPTFQVFHCQQQVGNSERSSAFHCTSNNPDVAHEQLGYLLRGGSTAVHYAGDYFVAMTHTAADGEGYIEYASQITMFNIKTEQVVFVSSPIFISPKFAAKSPNFFSDMFQFDSIYSTGLIIENDDSFLISLGVNDNGAYLARVTGFSSLFSSAMANDRLKKVSNFDKGELIQSWLYSANHDELVRNNRPVKV